MQAIRICRKLESETLPELKPFVGRNMEIVVREELTAAPPPGHGDWDAVASAIRDIKNYDYGAQTDQDACDIRHAADHLS